MELVVQITFYLALFLGSLLLLTAIGSQIIRKTAPPQFLYIGLVLIILPVVKSVNLGAQGLEFETNAQKELKAQVAAIEAIQVDTQQQMSVVRKASFSADSSVARPIAVDSSAKLMALVLFSDDSMVDRNVVIEMLRNNGYLSSSIATDFSELGDKRKQYKPGQAYIKYERGLEGQAKALKALLANVSGMGTITTKEVKSFRAGDIQIALF